MPRVPVFLNVPEVDKRRVFCSSVFARQIQFFESLITVARAGWPSAGMVLDRAILEALFSLGAATKSVDILELLCEEDDEFQRMRALHGLWKTDTARQQFVTEPTIPRDPRLSVFRLAEAAGLESRYRQLYPVLSIEAHVKPRSLDPMHSIGPDGHLRLSFGRTDSHTVFNIGVGIRLLDDSLRFLGEAFDRCLQFEEGWIDILQRYES